MRSMLIRFTAVCFLATLAHTQQTYYQTDFSNSAGWTLEGCWAVDDLPALPGGVAHSGTTSLNCNDVNGGYVNCYDDYATSPVIDLSVTPGAKTVTFWCRWATEDTGFCAVDAKHLLVTDPTTQIVYKDTCFTWGGLCPQVNEWHQHPVDVDPAWGQVRLRFWFDVGDELFNSGYGWLVDDLAVIDGCPTPVTYCTAKVNSAGCTPTVGVYSGKPSYSGSGNPLMIRALSVLNQQTGMLIWSRNPASLPFGGGTLCLASPVLRTPASTSHGSSPPTVDCTGNYFHIFYPSFLQAQGLTPGTQVYAQFWSRDPGFSAPANMGLTPGVSFQVCP